MKALYDKLASLLRGMKPERHEALGEYLDELAANEGHDDDAEETDHL